MGVGFAVPVSMGKKFLPVIFSLEFLSWRCKAYFNIHAMNGQIFRPRLESGGMSRRNLTALASAWLCLWGACGGLCPVTAAASSRTETAARAQAGLALVDSLLGADQAALAVREARSLFDLLGADPLYGWQVEGRLGLALLRNGSPELALPHLETVMRRNLADPVGHRNFAAALLATGKKGRALTEFRQAVELAPLDYEVRLEYGQILAEFGDFREARTQLEVARHLCGGCGGADSALAGVLLATGEYAAASDILARLLEKDPSPWARRNLGAALAGAGRDGPLLAFLDSCAATGLSAQEMNLAVEAEGRSGQASRSLACLKALDDPAALPGGLDSGLLTDHAFWGRVSLNLLASGLWEDGLAAADRAVGLDPGNAVYRNNRVVLLLKLQRPEEAALEWAEVLKLDPSLEKKDAE